ncbi:MAG: outer membrane beta-barrel protein [Amaricoccus sp.]
MLRPAFFWLFSGSVLASGPAMAVEGFYLKGFGGIAFVQDASLGILDDPDFSFRYDYDPGYVLGAAAGLQVTGRLAVEAEASYRQAHADVHAKLDDRSPEEPIYDTWQFGETVKARSLMLNLRYSFDPVAMGPVSADAGGRLRPYVGAGLGGTVLDFGDDSTDPHLAWQLFAGLSYDLGQAWSLFGEARWFKTDGGTIHQDPSDGSDWLQGSFESIDMLFGVSYRF